MAVETAKEVAADKTLRNKAEKERRLREKAQNNTKKFIEERKITAMKQGKEKEKLVAMHAKQLEDLNRDIQLVTFYFFLIFTLNAKHAQGYACVQGFDSEANLKLFQTH
jgi:plasmid maintenance system killer protein